MERINTYARVQDAAHYQISSITADKDLTGALIGSVFDFTQSRGFNNVLADTAMPLAIDAHLSIPNINVHNLNVTFTINAVGTYNIVLVEGYYSRAALFTALVAAMNAAVLAPHVFTTAYNVDGQYQTVDLAGGSSFRFEACTFLQKSTYLLQMAYNNAFAVSQRAVSISMIYTPFIYVICPQLIEGAKQESNTTNFGQSYLTSFPVLDHLDKRYSYSANDGFGCVQYNIGTKRPLGFLNVLLRDIFGDSLNTYCPKYTTDFFSLTLQLTIT